jgi:hypothetical protein
MEIPMSESTGRGDELRFAERAKPFAEKYRFASYQDFIQRVGSDSGLAITVVEHMLKEKFAQEDAVPEDIVVNQQEEHPEAAE